MLESVRQRRFGHSGSLYKDPGRQIEVTGVPNNNLVPAGIDRLAIGLTITMDVFMGGPLTGAAMNPARAFGPELLGNFWGEGWIYYLGPVIGALIAAFAYDYLYLRPTRPAVVGTPESGVAEPRPGDTALD